MGAARGISDPVRVEAVVQLGNAPAPSRPTAPIVAAKASDKGSGGGTLNVQIRLTGNPEDVTIQDIHPGLVLEGGPYVAKTFDWLSKRAHGGDVVVLETTTYNDYNKFIPSVVTVGKGGDFNSVRTLIIQTKDQANLPQVKDLIEKAEIVCIDGGDQDNYLAAWKGRMSRPRSGTSWSRSTG